MIENKNWNKEEAAAIAVAEESREEKWLSKGYMASIFMGDFDLSTVYPYPFQEAEDKDPANTKMRHQRYFSTTPSRAYCTTALKTAPGEAHRTCRGFSV